VSRRLWLAAVVAVVVLSAVAYVVATTDNAPRGLQPVGVNPFDGSGHITPGPYRAAFSEDGSQLAVLGSTGVFLAQQGQLRPLSAGAHVVDMAWLPRQGGVLVAEGPASTGQLAAVRPDGKTVATVALRPPFAVGSGRGMAAADDSRTAVLTAVDRDVIGGAEHTHLVRVELVSGKVTDLPGTEGASRPYTTRDDAVFFTVGTETRVLLASGQQRTVAPGESAGVIDGTWLVYTSGRRVQAVPIAGGPAHTLARLPVGASLAAVSPAGGRAVRVELRLGSGDVQLVEQRLAPVPSTKAG
jgi:hypothetical protein